MSAESPGTIPHGPIHPAKGTLSWSDRYGERHRLIRIAEFPKGIAGPKKVRLYQRHDHYVLQWWDPAAKTNLSDRVDGDLVAAITRARQIEERLVNFRSSGQTRRHLDHQQVVQDFLQSLNLRADAGEIDPRTVIRYKSALDHYLAFAQRPETERYYPRVAGVNRKFQLEFASFLNNRLISSNGHLNAKKRQMKNPGFVEDAVRAMFEWAGDPDRGNLLPDGFRNPFLLASRHRRNHPHDAVGQPDITMAMAMDFIAAADPYQLGLFAPIIFYGLRAAEPRALFREHIQNDWLSVPCISELSILTKGRRNKSLPLLADVRLLWDYLNKASHGLLFVRRSVFERHENVPLQNASLAQLIEEFRDRCGRCRAVNAVSRNRIRDAVLADAGGIKYDHVEAEFHRVASRLGWSRTATVKDFRHLFSTALENAGVPIYFRQYLMGQAPTKAPITIYTHLAPDQIRKHYDRALEAEFQPVVAALQKRIMEIGVRAV